MYLGTHEQHCSKPWEIYDSEYLLQSYMYIYVYVQSTTKMKKIDVSCSQEFWKKKRLVFLNRSMFLVISLDWEYFY